MRAIDNNSDGVAVQHMALISRIKLLKFDLEVLDLNTFHILRHAKTEYNIKRIIQGSAAIHVPVDTSQVKYEMLNDVANNNYDKVFCSPALRAIQTASIAEKFDICIVDKLNEIDWGDEDCKNMQYNDAYKRINYLWFVTKNKHLYVNDSITNGENLIDFANRILDCMDSIVQSLKDSNSKDVLIVGHGLWSAILFSMLIEENPSSLEHKLNNCEVTNILNHI